MAAEPNAQVLLRLTAASDCTDSVLHGTVRLVCPDGWTAEPAELPFVLPRGEHLEADIELTMPPDTAPGSIRSAPNSPSPATTRSRCRPRGGRSSRTSAPSSVGATADADVLRLVGEPEPVDVAAGETARLAVTVGTDAHADLAVEAHLISPWGTWEWMGPAAVGAELPARGTVELGFDVAPPAWVQPGEWWALIRVGCAGRLVYSPAVKVTVR